MIALGGIGGILLIFLLLCSSIRPLLSLQPITKGGQCPLQVPVALRANNPTELTNNRRPGLITIAHRGASFSLPEHSLPAYRLALELGADYIEPDLVATKDKRLIAVHSFDLNITTNIRDVYPDRHRVIEKNGIEMSGYFAFDFSLQELQSIRVKQRVDGRSRAFDFQFPIPTLQDILHLLYDWNQKIHPLQNQTNQAGVYIELKSPEFYLERFDISLADLFLEEMAMFPHADEVFFNHDKNTTFGCEVPNSYQVPPLVLQCFHGETMRYLRDEFVSRDMAVPPFVYLVEKKKCHLPTFWYEVGRMGFLSGIGPDKECLLGEAGYEFMMESKKLDLAVHPWTTRDEMEFVSSEFGTAEEELRYLYCKRGISGMFTENVDLGVKVGVRGCDDFLTAQEILEEDIAHMEEKNNGQLNGTVSREICSRNKMGENNFLANFGFMSSGVAIGFLLSMIVGKKLGMGSKRSRSSILLSSVEKRIQRGKMRGMQTLSTVSDDDDDIVADAEII